MAVNGSASFPIMRLATTEAIPGTGLRRGASWVAAEPQRRARLQDQARTSPLAGAAWSLFGNARATACTGSFR